jgi:hypothetical protein
LNRTAKFAVIDVSFAAGLEVRERALADGPADPDPVRRLLCQLGRAGRAEREERGAPAVLLEDDVDSGEGGLRGLDRDVEGGLGADHLCRPEDLDCGRGAAAGDGEDEAATDDENEEDANEVAHPLIIPRRGL